MAISVGRGGGVLVSFPIVAVLLKPRLHGETVFHDT